jgi:hypothetical protein
VRLERASADLEHVQRQLAFEHPKSDAQIRPSVVPLNEAMVGGVSRSLWLLLGAVSVLLLIPCTNIAALLLSRGAQRRNEGRFGTPSADRGGLLHCSCSPNPPCWRLPVRPQV